MPINSISYISNEEAESKINELKLNKNAHVAVINGDKVKTWDQYLKQIEIIYNFPTKGDNFNGYADWMMDLSWMECDSFALFIMNYDDFMCREPENKKHLMLMFLDTILPWWQHDIELYCVEGKPKQFNVYLVNTFIR